MPANTTPIFSIVGETQWTTSAMTAINTGHISTSATTNSYLVFSAGTNGSYVQKIRFRHLTPNSNTSATVARVWINNGTSIANFSASTLWDEVTIAANTVVQNSASINYELPLGFALPPNYAIYATIGTAPAGSGLQATVIGGDY
jgi:hypothetical protein